MLKKAKVMMKKNNISLRFYKREKINNLLFQKYSSRLIEMIPLQVLKDKSIVSSIILKIKRRYAKLTLT